MTRSNDYNPYHKAAGSPEGGRFTTAAEGGGGGGSSSDDDTPLPKSAKGKMVYDLPSGESVSVRKRSDGTFYGEAEDFDFEAKTEKEMLAKLKKWGAKYAGSEHKDAAMFLSDELTFDRKGVTRTKDGYLVAYPQIARTGIQIYGGKEMGRPEMERVRVYRPEAEVFKKDALKSFTGLPTTLNHPPEMVTADNWKKYATGETGEEILRDGERMRVPMILKDAAAIQAFDTGAACQLSVGYTCDVKWEPGKTEDGQEYDAVQTNIRANHLALVPAARGGPELRIGDNNPENGPMKMIMIDGISVELQDKDAQIVTRHVASLEQKISDNAAFMKKKEEEAEEKKKKYDADTAALQAQIATKDTEIATLTKKVADAALSPEKIDAMVADRQAVVDKAKVILADKLVVDGKTTADIRKQVVDAHLGDVAKSYTEDMHRAAFDAIKVDTTNVTGNVYDAARALSQPAAPNLGNVRALADAAYQESIKALEGAWQGNSKAN